MNIIYAKIKLQTLLKHKEVSHMSLTLYFTSLLAVCK